MRGDRSQERLAGFTVRDSRVSTADSRGHWPHWRLAKRNRRGGLSRKWVCPLGAQGPCYRLRKRGYLSMCLNRRMTARKTKLSRQGSFLKKLDSLKWNPRPSTLYGNWFLPASYNAPSGKHATSPSGTSLRVSHAVPRRETRTR